MNRHRYFPAFLLVVLLALVSTSGALRAAEPLTYSIALQYSSGDRPARTAFVSHAVLGDFYTNIPLQITDAKTWVITIGVNDADGTFSVSADDLAIITPAGVAQIFSARFKLASGKAVTVLRTPAGTLDVTITKD